MLNVFSIPRHTTKLFLFTIFFFLPSVFHFFYCKRGLPIVVWGPVIENDFGQEMFLIDDPIKLFLEGNFSRVPVIAGMTENEFIDPAQSIPQLFFLCFYKKKNY